MGYKNYSLGQTIIGNQKLEGMLQQLLLYWLEEALK